MCLGLREKVLCADNVVFVRVCFLESDDCGVMANIYRIVRLRGSNLRLVPYRGIVPSCPKMNICLGCDFCLYHSVCGACPVALCGMMLYLYVASRNASSQCASGKFAWCRLALSAFMTVCLIFSAVEFSWGLSGFYSRTGCRGRRMLVARGCI